MTTNKPTKKFVSTLLVFYSILITSCSERTKANEEGNPLQVSLYHLSCTETPVTKIHIEENEYVLKIDLGANCDIMLKQRALDQIKNKTFIGSSKGIDIQGNQYEQPDYIIPIVKLNNLQRSDVTVSEENLFFVAKGSKPFCKGNETRIQNQISQIDGRIGTEFLQNFVCYFDPSHSLMLVGSCIDEITKFQQLNDFTEAPFEFDKGIIYLTLMTDEGLKKFILDTGASQSVVNQSSFPLNCKNFKTKNLILESMNLGRWNFVVLNFPEQLNEIDGILGMDFFNRHEVCINFPEKKLFLKKTKLGMFRSHFNRY